MKINNKIKFLGLGLFAALALTSCNEGNTPAVEKPDYVVYVSPTGSPDATGTKADPLSFPIACMNAKPGTTILMLDGKYEYSSRLELKNNGSPNKYITVKPATANDNVVFDFSKMAFASNNRGIQLYGNFWHFKDIDVTGAGDNGLYIAGSYNIIERCDFYNNRDTGLQLGRAYSADTTINTWPSYNLIKNCTSFANYDAETLGENADGFACKLTSGYGNVFDGCIAFRNSDDGWDLYAKEDSGDIGAVILYNCVSFENGYLPYQIERVNDADGSKYMSYNTMNGDGIGFKLGGSVMEGNVILENCLAMNNKLHGFGDNSNPGFINIKNSTAINNCISLSEDGKVAGRDTDGGKSNNFDLARAKSHVSQSYNNYYGLVSYIDNQSSFTAGDGTDDEDMSYNVDKFRGIATYSILNTSYDSANKKEKYVQFTTPVDASSYVSSTNDITFSQGTEFTGMSADCFASIDSINALCKDVNDLTSLLSINTKFRNEDGSVNMHDTAKIVNNTLLTFADGNPIGANLSKASDADYPHYYNLDFSKATTGDEVRVEAAYQVTEAFTNTDSVFQDFKIPLLIHNCDISWESSNPAVASIEKDEMVSVSEAVFGKVKIYTPETNTKVTLTATISCGSVTKVKTFELNVIARSQSMGAVVVEGSSAIRVEKFSTYIAPRVYPLDISAIGTRELTEGLYEMNYTYEYAASKDSEFYPVDGVYSSVAGVYKVTATATSLIVKDNYKESSTVFYAYVIDKDCDIDFILNEEGEKDSQVVLTADGFVVNGNVSNIYGDVYAVYSKDELSLTAEELLAREDVQKAEISTDFIQAQFNSGDLAGKKYYAYYVLSNKNKTKTSEVYSFVTDVREISTKEQFYELATTGKSGSTATTSTTIYALANDLDFTDYTWSLDNKSSLAPFVGQFNGNGYTIKNISIEGSSANKNTNLFYKVENGSIINAKFENISIVNKDSSAGKLVGIVGQMQGGYMYNISMNNITVAGAERVGGLVGQIIGGYNYFEKCQLINTTATLTVKTKYLGGIVGEMELDSALAGTTIAATFKDCAVIADIGDGKDTGGCSAGILGRAKPSTKDFYVTIESCYYKGTITAYGNYNAGIIGDISEGNGQITINNCFSDSIFMYRGTELNAYKLESLDDVQKYAHKNENPICGRATYTKDVGSYTSANNVGTWTEYYGDQISSLSILFDLSYVDEETYELKIWTPTENFFSSRFDFENTWVFDAETKTLHLK